jgi:hypothetical protein
MYNAWGFGDPSMQINGCLYPECFLAILTGTNEQICGPFVSDVTGGTLPGRWEENIELNGVTLLVSSCSYEISTGIGAKIARRTCSMQHAVPSLAIVFQ